MNRRAAVAALALYAGLSLVMTWPLARGLTRDVPGDLGDSLLNMWILGWGAEHLPRMLAGQSSWSDYWNANIFHPEPLTLGLSEHLFGEVLQILPVYWLTGNLILCYNLLFISSFALSGLGMFLLTRDLLESHRARFDVRTVAAAAFIAGLLFAFLPFRIAQVAHIQSLQAQWMPLALYGFRRFTISGRAAPLVGGTMALLMQNWTNGYYLIFFAPFVPVFVAHQVWVHGRLRDLRAWTSLAGGAVIVVLGTWPFLSMYLETQRAHAFERPLGEVLRFSADVYSYLTAPEALRAWGGVMRALPKPEGELFFGFGMWLLALIAVLAALASAFDFSSRRRSVDTGAPGYGPPRSRLIGIAGIVLRLLLAAQLVALGALIFTGGFITSLAGIPIRATNAARLITGIIIVGAVVLCISRDARPYAQRMARSPFVLCGALAVLALLLSLGPMPQSYGRPIEGLGLYGVLYEKVPGFAGLRVPARYAMIAAVFLSSLAALGAARLLAWRKSRAFAATLGALLLVDVAFVPMTVNATWGDGATVPPARVEPADEAPAVYHTLAMLPGTTVVAEFPFGDPAWELRYVYYSTVHWKRLLNGYSGAFPQGYRARAAVLQRVREHPEAAWRALRDAGTTHVVVHTHALAAGESQTITRWLEEHFAVEIARFDGDLLYDVAGMWPPPQ